MESSPVDAQSVAGAAVVSGSGPGHAPPASSARLALALGALGVVYGDIGTSPLYAMRECFHGPHAFPLDATNVLGVLSLIVWSLIVVISIKYVVFVMRADNHGEGGILALMALVCPRGKETGHLRDAASVAVGLFGAALLYGDGMITPAISVLSAVEGLQVAAPDLGPFVLPITVVILIALFSVQSRGTAGIGAVFGPIILVWFLALSALGIAQIVRNPDVLAAFSPAYAAAFFAHNGWHGILVLGAVFLVVTGGEALYADMGHFGKAPIRLAWFAVVLPGLLLNYFGQGALLLAAPGTSDNPFFRMMPSWAVYPMIGLSTAATVIASQALISGAFSLTHQAVQLGYLPRVRVRHTSAREMGQIYIPEVNWALLVACIGLVLVFRSSSSLAAAYGVAVTTTMMITTALAFRAMNELWGWKLGVAAGLSLFFLVVDVAFFSANIVKVADGGWFPLAIGAVVYVAMATWRDGRQLLADRLEEQSISTQDYLAQKAPEQLPRVPGTAVFMTAKSHGVPPALVQNIRHNKVLHQRVLMVTVLTEPEPYLSEDRRVEVEDRGNHMYRVRLRYGFLEQPAVPAALARLPQELRLDPEDTTYFVGIESLFATERPGLALWRERLFVLMSRNAGRAVTFFQIPPEQVIEIGVHIDL